MVALLARVGQIVLDLLFPPRCAVCGTSGSLICESCQEELPRALPPRCPICWQRQRQGAVCSRCQLAKPFFDAARSPYIYQGGAQEIVQAFKYGHLSALAPVMSRLMASHLEGEPMEADMVVAVPLAGGRQRARGYNQSALLARGLSKLCRLPFGAKVLTRERDTPPQARTLEAEARRLNVAEAFSADPRRVTDRRILLVDDVMTTGATLDACAQALRQAGATSVWALTFARED